MSQVLITGATGLVGGHLLRMLNQHAAGERYRRADASPADGYCRRL
ncbi:putative nucleoside-diphosphate-sugar epimerase [Salmonella enterica subsp. enterica]|uniref:Putative nucleoside-diphosphate-sugar epimerase n=1 Tax=Salmonella enterica I TaxID=59201 RepID=A0A447TUX4_SALET|nr:putative nucleoside-diphosphate-sugar epimerase [Salmonella enterica subsp. enterica]